MAEATGPVSIMNTFYISFPISVLPLCSNPSLFSSPVFLQNGFIKIKQKEKEDI